MGFKICKIITFSCPLFTTSSLLHLPLKLFVHFRRSRSFPSGREERNGDTDDSHITGDIKSRSFASSCLNRGENLCSNSGSRLPKPSSNPISHGTHCRRIALDANQTDSSPWPHRAKVLEKTIQNDKGQNGLCRQWNIVAANDKPENNITTEAQYSSQSSANLVDQPSP